MSVRDDKKNPFSVVAGGFAGTCSTVVTNPFDVLKSRLAASREATGVVEKSLLSHFRALFQDGIVKGFTVGLAINLVSSVPSNAIYLPSYHFLKHESTELGLSEAAIPVVSAAGAVTATNMTLAPLFILRTQVQLNSEHSFMHYGREILRKDGFKGFYRGTGVNIAGRFVEEAAFWSVYEQLKIITQEGKIDSNNLGWASFAVLSLSSVAKLIGTSISYPYNVVMTHFREVNKVTGLHDHTKVIPTLKYIHKKDGIWGFYKGLAPQLMRSVLSKATQIWSFEMAMAAYFHFNENPVAQVMTA